MHAAPPRLLMSTKNEPTVMAGASSAEVALRLLGYFLLLVDRLGASGTIDATCSTEFSAQDELAKFEQQPCNSNIVSDSDHCNSSIIAFYNKKVNPRSASSFVCIVQSLPVASVDEIELTSSMGQRLVFSNPAFLTSSSNVTAIKVFDVSSVLADETYTCIFTRQPNVSSANAASINASWTIYPTLYTPPVLVRQPEIRATANTNFVLWQKWSPELDRGDGPVIRYDICLYRLFDHNEKCQALEGDWKNAVYYQLGGLMPGRDYTIYVHSSRPCNFGVGDKGPATNHTEPCGNPGGSLVIAAPSTEEKSGIVYVNVTWKLPLDLRLPCDIPSYINIRLSAADSVTPESRIVFSRNGTSALFQASPDTDYTVAMFYLNVDGKPSVTTEHTFKTMALIPERPGQMSVYMRTNSSVLVEWESVQKYPKSVLAYQVRYKKNMDDRATEPTFGCELMPPFSRYQCIIPGLMMGLWYTFEVRAKTAAGYGESVHSDSFHMKYTAPQPISRLANRTRTSESIELEWDPPDATGGLDIIEYRVECSSATRGQPLHVTAANVHLANVTGLAAGTEHVCSIEPRNGITRSVSKNFKTIRAWTLAAKPALPRPPKLDTEGNSATSIGLRLPVVSAPASLLKVVVELVDSDETKERQHLSLDDCPSFGESEVCYTAGMFLPPAVGSLMFTVGDNKMSGNFLNAPLVPSQRYILWFGVGVTVDGITIFSYSCLEEPVTAHEYAGAIIDAEGLSTSIQAGVIVGIVCAVVVVVVAVILVILTYFRRRHVLFRAFSRTPADEKALEMQEKGGLLKGNSLENLDLSRQPNGEPVYDNVELKRYPVLLSELAAYIDQKKQDGGFRKEYMLIRWGLTAKCDAAKRPENKHRNRYGNIIAYDHSRVVLVCDSFDVTSDYINANYMDGYESPRAYIATQGPTHSTIKDFWHMVWHEHAPAIVMVTNTVEMGKSKCEQYWPEAGATLSGYGNLSVSVQCIKSWASYTMHVLKVEKGGETRTVKHFHFKDWPDHGVPAHATSLLAFLKTVRVECARSTSLGPIVHHCSAGVGRTGTFIALDALLQQAKAEGKIDVYTFVCCMRKQRCNMIQTMDQYVFLHEALLEAVLGLDTGYRLPAFADRFGSLPALNALQESPHKFSSTDAVSNKYQFDAQFETLKHLKYGKPDSYAILSANERKNRDVSILPSEGTRVPLMYVSPPPPGSTDYINACFVEDYHRKQAFIATQTPLPDTVENFWKMICDRQVSTILMLNTSTEEEEEEQQFTVYWPTDPEQTLEYATVSIRLVHLQDQSEKQGIVVRTFSVTAKNQAFGGNSALNVTHYACNFWPDSRDFPTSKNLFVDLLITLVKGSTEMGSNDESPITVHCLDGAKQTGVYLTCHILLQQMLFDDSVDVFQVVKLIRGSRPQFIANSDQLRYCYEVVLDCMNRKLKIVDSTHTEDTKPQE